MLEVGPGGLGEEEMERGSIENSFKEFCHKRAKEKNRKWAQEKFGGGGVVKGVRIIDCVLADGNFPSVKGNQWCGREWIELLKGWPWVDWRGWDLPYKCRAGLG